MNNLFDKLFKIDWQQIFVPTESILEIFIRGTIMYLVMFALLRIFRRQAGSIGIADLLVIVVIADAAQNGMAGDSKSVTEAVLLIATIVIWDYFLDWLGYRFEFASKILEPKPLTVIKNGKVLRRNLKKEMISEDELESQLREHGIENIKDVKRACLESDGHFSFIKKENGEQKSNVKKKKTVN